MSALLSDDGFESRCLRWRASASAEAFAYGAEPFYGLDGSLYLVYGAREPGNIQIVQLNESSARLPRAAQPGQTNTSEATLFHEVAKGPSLSNILNSFPQGSQKLQNHEHFVAKGSQ